ncbi:MAG: hypothetical protein KH828_01695 [Clostridiales bacterium]|nr:hypothetical protein [Clostridiales bacterium]
MVCQNDVGNHYAPTITLAPITTKMLPSMPEPIRNLLIDSMESLLDILPF